MKRFLLLALFLAACSSPDMTHPLERTIRATIAEADSARTPEMPPLSVAVSVVDPSTGFELHVNGEQLFHAASTMKVPVMIEVFRQVDAGRFSMSDEIVLRNEFRSIVDGSTFSIEDDSDDASYEHLGSPMSLADLTYNMIIVSSNLATNLLIDVLSADSVQATSERLGTTHMQTLRGVEDLKAFEQGLSNRATSKDLARLMTHLMNGTAVSRQADASMRQILFDQRFNDMIPAGLPPDVKVAHKTGQITRINHDAAIVYPPNAEPYVLVILIEGVDDHAVSAALGARIAGQVHEHLRGGD
jgi:beta-lactamase class A